MNFLAVPLFAGCGSPLASFTQYDNKKRAEHMSNARMAKARAGAVVSSLPVGWIKGPDGKYDFDPEVKDAIPAIIDTFRQQRSIRRTIKALAEAGNQSTLQTREAALLRKAKSQQHKEPKPAVNSP